MAQARFTENWKIVLDYSKFLKKFKVSVLSVDRLKIDLKPDIF